MEKKQKVKRIFDSIAHRYDLLNHLLSAGIDFYWRKKALQLTGINEDAQLLDVACGTGDFAIAAAKLGVANIFGADLSLNMLKLFDNKSRFIKGSLVQAVGEDLPFKDNSFSNITVAFGVRNFYDIRRGFKSFHRILANNGKATILEFRLPSVKIIKSFYLFYFNRILPAIGKLISRDKEAYTYLPSSVNEFDEKIDLVETLESTGFKEIKKHSLTFGIVQVVVAVK